MPSFVHGRVEAVHLLLEAGVDKDFANNQGVTGLMMASQEGHVEVVRLLLEASAANDVACNTEEVTA